MGAGVSLTPAGMTVAVLSRVPGQVVIEILTLLTVKAASVVFADAGPMNLGGWEHLGAPGQPPAPYKITSGK